MVLNLTNPRSHYDVTEACLEAGKHVYSEKPLGMTLDEARDLVALADARGVRLGTAPCSVLSNTAQTVWKAIEDGVIGTVRLVYANYDDGMIAPNQQPWNWQGASGAHWPAKDEFEVGCTYEHAGYFLTWLNAFFGPAHSVQAYASCRLPDKGIEVDGMAPDFTAGCIEYESGVVARVTCGLVAPEDKSLTIVGDDGYLFVRHLRNDAEPVYLRKDRMSTNAHRVENLVNRLQRRFSGLLDWLPWPSEEFLLYSQVPFVLNREHRPAEEGKPVNFMLGPDDMARAILEDRPHRLSAELGVHVVEQIEALQYPEEYDYHRTITSSLPDMEPLWT
jgi:predicted dehydrogenase